MQDEPDILMRVLFEFAVAFGEENLEAAVEGAVKREDLHNAGAMPDLEDSITKIKELVVARYYSVKKEKGLP